VGRREIGAEYERQQLTNRVSSDSVFPTSPGRLTRRLRILRMPPASARRANEQYVESLARVLHYWGYPAVDTFGRTSMWEAMKTAGPGATLGLFPGALKNMMGYLDDYIAAQGGHAQQRHDLRVGLGGGSLERVR
jgi:hypothetical protein